MGGGGNSVSQDSRLISGEPGEYTLYRAGEVERRGFVFLTTDKDVADSYSEDGTRAVSAYKVQINNPLVIDASTDTEALRNAWLELHPTKGPQDYRNIIKGNLTAAKWQRIDADNARALLNTTYDAVVYKNGNKIREVWVHSSRRSSFKNG